MSTPRLVEAFYARMHWLAAAWFRFEAETIADLWVVSDISVLDALLGANQSA